MHIRRIVALGIILAFCSVSANAVLLGRLDGQAVYDTDRDITWVADANLLLDELFGLEYGNLGPHPMDLSGRDGIITDWGGANWAGALHYLDAMNAANYLGFNDWRFPNTLNPDPSCQGPSTSTGRNCIGSEMGHLFYEEFGAPADTSAFITGDPAALALFNNLGNALTGNLYWSSLSLDDNSGWAFRFDTGLQVQISKNSSLGVWPVRDGDVIDKTTVVSAILPASRSVQVGNTATVFATILNAGAIAAINCRIMTATALDATLLFQTTDPLSNALVGTPDLPVDIAAGGGQSFLIALTPNSPVAPTDVQFHFLCDNANPAPVVTGLSTLLLSAEDVAIPDVIALGATLMNDGVVHLQPDSGFFTVATVNVGAADTITAVADTGEAELPVTIVICETNPTTSECLMPPVDAAGGVSTVIGANATPTFAVFITSTEPVGNDPAANRIVVRFKDAGGITRGATSVAVRTGP